MSFEAKSNDIDMMYAEIDNNIKTIKKFLKKRI